MGSSPITSTTKSPREVIVSVTTLGSSSGDAAGAAAGVVSYLEGHTTQRPGVSTAPGPGSSPSPSWGSFPTWSAAPSRRGAPHLHRPERHTSIRLRYAVRHWVAHPVPRAGPDSYLLLRAGRSARRGGTMTTNTTTRSHQTTSERVRPTTLQAVTMVAGPAVTHPSFHTTGGTPVRA